MAEELEFDDFGLEDPISTDENLETDNGSATNDTTADSQTDPENQPEPKKKGRPKKDVQNKGVSTNDGAEETSGKDDFTDPKKKEINEELSEESIIKSMAQKLGIELEDEIEDSEEGLEQFVQLAADNIADAKLNEWLQSLPPVASDFFDYLQLLGEDANEDNIKQFFSTVKPEIDYKSIDINNEDVQKSVMRSFFKKMDYTDEEIKEAIEDMEISNTLRKQAEIASKKLAAMQEKERAKLIEQEKEQENLRRQNTQRFFSNVKQILDQGKVNNFTIPVTERKAIFDYDTKGQFMEDLNAALKDPAKRVELAIALKNKFNLSKYVAVAATTAKANTLKEKLLASQGKTKNGANTSQSINSDIDWDTL
jgi:hypothetical protein